MPTSGQKNNLDALCKRYGVDNSNRELHGALLDAEILADVYLLMTGGQTALSLDAGAGENGGMRGLRRVRETVPGWRLCVRPMQRQKLMMSSWE